MSDTVKLIIEIDKKTVAHIRSHYGHGCKGMYDDDRDRIVDAIYNATPLDDVRENIHGEWLKHSCYKGMLICSNCNHGSNMYDKDFDFCPNCGCQMNKTESEDK